MKLESMWQPPEDMPMPPMEPIRILIMGVTVEVPSEAVRVNISMEKALLMRIDRAAQRRGMTRSAYLAAGARTLLEAASEP